MKQLMVTKMQKYSCGTGVGGPQFPSCRLQNGSSTPLPHMTSAQFPPVAIRRRRANVFPMVWKLECESKPVVEPSG